MIQNYTEFCDELIKCGFSMGGGNDKGIFALINFDWKDQETMDSPVIWHTGDRETDPWEWRMRVLEERKDIAYSKLFFQSSGYITKEWYPYFYAARRQGKILSEEYDEGNINSFEKRIYEILSESNKVTPLDEIKRLGSFAKEDKSKFDRAITSLQMKMYITICGRSQKINKFGEPYGWHSTSFCTVEKFWTEDVIQMADDILVEEAEEKIKTRILELNPFAQEKKMKKFIYGI